MIRTTTRLWRTSLLLLSCTRSLWADEPPIAEMAPYTVAADRIATAGPTITQADFRLEAPNPGQSLLAVPGLFGQLRSADSVEPNLRGLGFDRVVTDLNGLDIPNASPERTHSPISVMGPVAVTSLTVHKALPSVTLGPAVTGGRLSMRLDPAASPPNGVHGSLGITGHGGRDGWISRLETTGAWPAWTGRVSAFHTHFSDYQDARGRTVPAALQEFGASAFLGWQSAPENPAHRLWGALYARRLDRAQNASLPLDGRDTETLYGSVGHRWACQTGPLEALEWRAGWSRTTPFITSADRPTPTLTTAVGTTQSAAATISADWRWSARPDCDRLTTGLDYRFQNRRATRYTSSGADYIWPDARSESAGLFAEWSHPWSQSWTTRWGARLDRFRSEAGQADRLALGQPIRQQYVGYNGPEAARTDRENWAGASNLLAEWHGAGGWKGFAGGGWTVQTPPITERYRAFLNALGGDGRGKAAFELGNPALRSEKKGELQTGLGWHGENFDWQTGLYYYRIADFIHRQPIGTTPAHLTVFGYRNIEAAFWGAENGFTWRPASGWLCSAAVAWAEGRNLEKDCGLPETPPLEAQATLRHEMKMPGRSWPMAVEFGVRWVAPHDNPAPLDNPIFLDTGAATICHLRWRIIVEQAWQLHIGVENLFDKQYAEYLSPPAGPFQPSASGLRPGDPVPGPGRYLYLSVERSF